MVKGDRCCLYQATEFEFFWRPVAPRLVQLIAGQAPRCDPELNTVHQWLGSCLTYEPAYALVLLQTAQMMMPHITFTLIGFTHAQLSQVGT